MPRTGVHLAGLGETVSVGTRQRGCGQLGAATAVLASAAALVLASGVRAQDVVVREESLVLPWYTSCPGHVLGQDSNRAFFSPSNTRRHEGDRTFAAVVLENRYLRVTVIPEIGGPIARAVHKPTGDDLFFFEGKAKDWLPFWESGVKASFPFKEHGMGLYEPASWRIVRRDDGAVTLAMWMEFSRHTAPCHRWQFGRFSNMLLSQHVTLRPREALVRVTYRIVNPAPYRQGRRIWNDALFPRHHTSEGVVQGSDVPPERTDTEWIFPAAYVSDHWGKDFRPYDASKTRVADYASPHNSIFGWGMAYGFAGLWYPQVRVNRLRIWDPALAPAAKQYFRGEGRYRPDDDCRHMCNFIELWGGTSNVFEGPEHWIDPGEAFAFSHRFALVSGIGKVDYADDAVAVNVEFGGEHPCLEVVTFCPVERLRASRDGRPLGVAGCGPDRPARFSLPQGAAGGHLALEAEGKVVLDRRFPLEVPDDTTAHQRIREAIGTHAAANEMCGNQLDYGRTYRQAILLYPEASVGRGRLLYRDGCIESAVDCLREAARRDPDDGEAWHLLGAALLEAGWHEEAMAAFQRATDSHPPYCPAGYYLALGALREGDCVRAERNLKELWAAEPTHWEARLLLAWVLSRKPGTREEAWRRARAIETEDPADPRAVFVLAACARARGFEEEARQAEAALERLLLEPGAARRLAEFETATRGYFRHPLRMTQLPKP